MGKQYTVVTNSFIAGARDGYYEFGNIPDEDKVDSFVEYAQSFIEYAQSIGVLSSVEEENASTQGWTDVAKGPCEDDSLAEIEIKKGQVRDCAWLSEKGKRKKKYCEAKSGKMKIKYICSASCKKYLSRRCVEKR